MPFIRALCLDGPSEGHWQDVVPVDGDTLHIADSAPSYPANAYVANGAAPSWTLYRLVKLYASFHEIGNVASPIERFEQWALVSRCPGGVHPSVYALQRLVQRFAVPLPAKPLDRLRKLNEMVDATTRQLAADNMLAITGPVLPAEPFRTARLDTYESGLGRDMTRFPHGPGPGDHA